MRGEAAAESAGSSQSDSQSYPIGQLSGPCEVDSPLSRYGKIPHIPLPFKYLPCKLSIPKLATKSRHQKCIS
jgi:hypothetical protein